VRPIGPRAGANVLGPKAAGVVVGLTGLASIALGAALGIPGALAPPIALVFAYLLISVPVDTAMPVIVALAVFLENPGERPYESFWRSPTQGLGELVFNDVGASIPGLPLAVSPLILALGILVLRVVLDRAGDHAQPLHGRWRRPRLPKAFAKACLLSAAVVAGLVAYGIARGGANNFAITQAKGYLILPMAALVVAGSLTRRHLGRLERVIVWGAVFKAAMAAWAYPKIRTLGVEYITTHSDSVLWVVALAILAAHWLHGVRPDARTRMLLLGPFIGLAIVVNARRTAWVALLVVGVLLMAHAPPRAKAHLRRLVVVFGPFLLIYSAIGWFAPPSTLFSPVQSVESVFNQDPGSSRDLEDLNLLYTLRNSGPTGTGLGHEYVQVFGGDDLSMFFDFRYFPHNSVLGLYAFGGALGFTLYWIPVVLGVAYALAAKRDAPDNRLVGAAATWMLGATVAFMVQAWADVGLQAQLSVLLGGIAVGVGGGLRGFVETSPLAREPDIHPAGITEGTTT
jgi:hypothetical protein